MSEDSKLLTTKAQSCNLQLNSVGNIKLCGYLKKKRNKVGGWRKMWFVLQDKLLLSYASKEEYDNKLVSFKDVLNLMPGTVVRPLSGYRFTIETTSNALYTFHCEDRYAYREWITTLLDSLSAKELRFKEQVHQQRVFNSYSMENLPNTPKNFILPMTHSFECIAHAATQRLLKTTTQTTQINSYNENCVRLPIVYKTAKILERNGGSGAQLKHNIKKQQKKKQQHEEEEEEQQEVHLPATIAVDCCLQLCCNNNNNNNKIVYHNNNNHSNKQINNNNNSNMHDKKQTTQKLRNSKVNAVITKNGLKQQQQQQSIDSYYKTCKACSKIQHENSSVCPKRYSSSEETETLSSHIDVAAETTSCLLGTSCSLEYMQEKLQKCSLENVPKESREQQARAKLKSAGSLTSLAKENAKTIEPIYAVVDLKNKYAHRQQQKAKQQEQESHLRRCNSYDSVLASIESQEEYAHKKSASYHDPNDIEAIYEDGELLLFSNPNNKTEMLNSLTCADCELENIYEPIDVRSTPRKTLWRYFTQLKVTPFLQLKNSIGSSNKHEMAHYESIEILKNKSSTTTKHLSSLRHKFGTHRRSMQLRMRKLFKQTKKPQHNNTTTATNHNHNNNNNCESCHMGKSIKNHHHNNKKPKSKYRLKMNKSKSDKTNFVPQKRFFGSLKHLRKPKVH